MTTNHAKPSSGGRRIGWKLTLLICVLILLSAAGLIALIFSTEPTAVRTAATKETAMLVETIRAEQGTFRPQIVAMGTVEPARDIILMPRVSGEIIGRARAFTPGGFVDKGEMLLKIDPADYENALRQRESDLREAIADLHLEMGRQHVARQDYQLLEETLSKENEALVLRKPQLNTARAQVESARAAVNQARLELERTTVKAPFDAHILNRNANIGSQVSPGDNLARLVGTETYWVAATVPLAKLPWLSFPKGPNAAGAEVQVRNRSAWPTGAYRTGRLYKLVGRLEDQTRMARVLVTVPDPLARKAEADEIPRLMIGAFVEARIKARAIPDVVRLNRDFLRKNNTVWVMRDDKLSIRDVEVVFQDADYAYIKSGLSGNELVVTTNLTTVVDGAKLRQKASDK